MAKKKIHPSATFILKHADPALGFPDELFGDPEGDEFDDTDATFSPGVLSLYPLIPPFPGATHYAVGYGSLVACDAGDRQIGVWMGVDEGWEAE